MAPPQPGTSDESCPQASTSASCSGPTICSQLFCCCTTAARSDGPDGNLCSWCGCGLCCGTHTGHAITGDFSGGSNAEPSRPDITYQEPQGTQQMSSSSSLDLASMSSTVFGVCPEPG
ncbi:Coiled-coil-helix-coiled-coil-helix domain-containing protein 2, mitochondrial [Tupaia chinensis]|uniref:Coiled-coil-helix-coiled-coil-helix domain-containing protein 2, mitochondrial n=1 Tax=Tupaia chinensis TaxID=246437 RepID=L9JC23_TUPCH|nr:Coiled-coil-helix-coiled-coil-helix domain-containing protein 2, mitochondrial [Tupaia chinensis]